MSKVTYFRHQKVKVMAKEGNVCPAMDSLKDYSPFPADNGPDLMEVRICGACMEEAPFSNLFGPIGLYSLMCFILVDWKSHFGTRQLGIFWTRATFAYVVRKDY